MSSYSSKNSCGKLRARSTTVHVGGMTARFSPDMYKSQHVFRGVRGFEQAGGVTDINGFSDINGIVVFLNVTPCSLVDGCQRYEETHYLHVYQTTWQRVPHDRRASSKSHIQCRNRVCQTEETMSKSVTKLISCTQVWYMAICPGRGALSAGSWPLALSSSSARSMTSPRGPTLTMAGTMRWVKKSSKKDSDRRWGNQEINRSNN